MGPYASSNEGYTVAVGPWAVILWAHLLTAGYIYTASMGPCLAIFALYKVIP
jgi:hypothetical protein